MLCNRQTELILPVRGIIGCMGGFDLSGLINAAFIHLWGGKIKYEYELFFGSYKLAEQFVTVVRIPTHKGKYFCKEDFAGNLLRRAFNSSRAPSERVFFVLLTWTDGEFLLMGIYEHLDKTKLRKFADACCIDIYFAVCKSERGFVGVGKKLSPDYLKAIKTEAVVVNYFHFNLFSLFNVTHLLYPLRNVFHDNFNLPCHLF